MAKFSFTNQSFNIALNSRERRILGRPHLNIDKSRLESVALAEFPGLGNIGQRVSRTPLFAGVIGEYRSNSKRFLVLGGLRKPGISLRLRISHPNIDEVWICAGQVAELEAKLASFIAKKS